MIYAGFGHLDLVTLVPAVGRCAEADANGADLSGEVLRLG